MDVVKSREISQDFGEDCGCSHSLPHWASSGGLELAVSIQVSFPLLLGEITLPNMEKCRMMAWISPLQTGLTLFVAWGIV